MGDALFAVLCSCGHNIRKILAHLRTLLRAIVAMIIAILIPLRTRQLTYAAA